MHTRLDGSTAAHYDTRNDSLARQRSRYVWIGSRHTTEPERRRPVRLRRRTTTGKCTLPHPLSPLIGSVYTVRYTPTRSYTTITASFSFSLFLFSCCDFLITEGLVTFVFLRAHIDNIYQKSFFIKLSETFREATITEVSSKGLVQILLNPRNMHAVGPSLRRTSQFFHRQQEPNKSASISHRKQKKKVVYRFSNMGLEVRKSHTSDRMGVSSGWLPDLC